LDGLNLSEEVWLVLIEIGQGDHTPVEHQNPGPVYVPFGMNRKRSLLTNDM
jgi:hypothetical protein